MYPVIVLLLGGFGPVLSVESRSAGWPGLGDALAELIPEVPDTRGLADAVVAACGRGDYERAAACLMTRTLIERVALRRELPPEVAAALPAFPPPRDGSRPGPTLSHSLRTLARKHPAAADAIEFSPGLVAALNVVARSRGDGRSTVIVDGEPPPGVGSTWVAERDRTEIRITSSPPVPERTSYALSCVLLEYMNARYRIAIDAARDLAREGRLDRRGLVLTVVRLEYLAALDTHALLAGELENLSFYIHPLAPERWLLSCGARRMREYFALPALSVDGGYPYPVYGKMYDLVVLDRDLHDRRLWSAAAAADRIALSCRATPTQRAYLEEVDDYFRRITFPTAFFRLYRALPLSIRGAAATTPGAIDALAAIDDALPVLRRLRSALAPGRAF